MIYGAVLKASWHHNDPGEFIYMQQQASTHGETPLETAVVAEIFPDTLLFS